jgi:hypothetical protein
VVICCAKPTTRTPQGVPASMKKRVEENLAGGQVPTGQITARIRAWVNA